jgi:hypothetical protein
MDSEKEKKELSWGKIFAGLIAIVVILALFAIPMMFIWNDVVPFLSNGTVPAIDYKQSFLMAIFLFCAGRCLRPGG